MDLAGRGAVTAALHSYGGGPSHELHEPLGRCRSHRGCTHEARADRCALHGGGRGARRFELVGARALSRRALDAVIGSHRHITPLTFLEIDRHYRLPRLVLPPVGWHTPSGWHKAPGVSRR